MANQAILLRTISAVDDKRLVLANGQAARVMRIGSDWNVLRVGVRNSINGSVSITGTPRLALGICSGTADLFLSETCQHFVGAITDGASLAYNTSGSDNYYNIASAALFTPYKKVGTTLTAGSAAFTAAIISANPASWVSAWILEITKGSPNFTLQAVEAGTGNVGQHITIAMLNAAMESGTLAGAAAELGGGYTVSTARTVAVDEGTNGDLDAVHLAWDRTVQTYENSTVRWRKMS